MELKQTQRGFWLVEHETYANKPEPTRLIQESSAIGDYENSFDVPGSSYLWIGDNLHLDREQVAELITHMQRWLDLGRLAPADDTPAGAEAEEGRGVDRGAEP